MGLREAPFGAFFMTKISINDIIILFNYRRDTVTIKISTANEKNQKMQRVKQEIKSLLGHKILNEVPEIKKSIEQLLVSLNTVTFKNTNPKLINGKMATVDEVLTMIKDSSDYSKWKLSHTEELDVTAIQEIKDTFNIEFTESEINRHMFYRSTNDRNALCTIIVTVLPGLFEVELQTDRVGYALDGLVNNKQFMANIECESDS